MKKIQLAALALVASMSMSAENTTKLRVWIGGEKTEYELSMVDSLTFCTNTDDEPEDPEASLAGVFSVSADKQVKFSQGNLQYTQSTDTWAFAENQYDIIGGANVDGEHLADKIDLFGWSGRGASTAKWGVSTSTSDNYYTGDFAEWGVNIDDTRWRTLSYDEWKYVVSNRTDADSKKGVARINLNAEGTTYANGLILLPDTWNCPEDVTFKSGFASESSEQAYADYQTFTLEEWSKLEAAGAVFLPATGNRVGLSVGLSLLGLYWSSTCSSDLRYAYGPHFGPNEIIWFYDYRCDGRAVRLVHDL